MSKALSLKMDEQIFSETEDVIRKIHVPRNAYINKAVAFYNRLNKRRLVKNRLLKDVSLLKGDTKEFIRNFELLEDLPE